MICVSIGCSRHKMVVLEHRALADKGAELVELRLDWLSRLPDLSRLVKERPTAVVVTCRRKEDRGRWRGNEDQRMTLLRAAILEGVEYVDVEEDIASKIPRYGKTKRIVSHHDFERTPDDLEEIHKRLSKLDPDIIKLVTTANSPGDSVRMLQILAAADVPTIGFCMGEYGLLSRILCGKYGAPFTYATFSREREMAPGQLSFEAMRDEYHYDRIGPDTQIYGVLGDPIAHSLSPVLHNTAFREAGLDAVYLPFRVSQETLSETLDDFEWLNVRGYSVTIPHKQAVLEKQLRKDEAVQNIGAANTLYRDESGAWHAANTDYEAAMESLRLGLATAPGEAAAGDDETAADAGEDCETRYAQLEGKKVLMLGAGGAARAIGMGVVRAGGVLTIASRSHKRAQSLAEQLACQHTQWENRVSPFADVLINCTPVGMHPNLDESPFQPQWLREGMLVFDTVYNPENTLLLKQARQRKCRTVSGLEMFVRQAALQFECFTGNPGPLKQMRQTLRRAISAVNVRGQ